MAETSGRPRGCLQRRRRTEGGLECSGKSRDERSGLSESWRRSRRDLELFGAMERSVNSAVALVSCKEGGGGVGPRTAHGGLGRLAGVLVMLGGGFGAVAEDWSGGTTPFASET